MEIALFWALYRFLKLFYFFFFENFHHFAVCRADRPASSRAKRLSREGTSQKKKNVENSTLGLTPPPMTENVENFQKKKKKLKKVLKNLTKPKIRQFP